MDDGYTTPDGVELPARALSWKFSRSSGPGGQHVNTSDTRATVTLDLLEAELEPAALARLLSAFGRSVSVSAGNERSQLQNRLAALERLGRKVDAALEVQAPRKETKVPRGVTEARLEAKRRNSTKKAQRRWDGNE